MPKLQLPPTTMQYPLREKIGAPHLFVGREAALKDFHKWVAGMPSLLSQSRTLLGRRKSGKTTFVQRLFNQIWSTNGEVSESIQVRGTGQRKVLLVGRLRPVPRTCGELGNHLPRH